MTHPNRLYVFKSRFKRWVARCIDTAGDFIISPWLQTRAWDSSSLKRILVLRLDHLGDVIACLPVIEALAHCKPKPFLAVAANAQGAELLRDTPGIDEIIVFDAPWFKRVNNTPRSIMDAWAFIKRIRKDRFDLAIDLRGDLRHHMLLTLAGIPRRASYGITGGGFLLHQELPWIKNRHCVDKNLAFTTFLRLPTPDEPMPKLIWRPTQNELEWHRSIVGKTDYFVVHVDAGTPAKRWPPQHFVELLRHLRQHAVMPVLVGANSKLNHELIPLLGHLQKIDLIGRTSLGQLITLIMNSKGVISTDSGPAHIAAALNRPVLILWSGTADPAVWKPRGRHVYIAQHHVPCEYCGYTRCPLREQLCVSELTVEIARPSIEQFTATCLGPIHA